MALSKIDVANMLTGVTPVANGGTAATTLAGAGLAKRPNAKPIIINGDMAIAQRGTSATGKTSSGYYTCDRIQLAMNDAGTHTIIQETSTSGNAYLNGFAEAYRVDCTTADASVAADSQLFIKYKVEARDAQVFKKGTANAQPYTLAFWVKSNKTGTGQVNLRDEVNTRQCSATYTISTADTWEHKICNFAADTTGALPSTNAEGFGIEWYLAAGSNFTSGTAPTAWEAISNGDSAASLNLAISGSTSNDFSLTGVQLEVGTFSAATLPQFQFESFEDSLSRCERYYQTICEGTDKPFGMGHYWEAQEFIGHRVLPTTMRTAPTLEYVSATNYYAILRDGGSDQFDDLSISSSPKTGNMITWYCGSGQGISSNTKNRPGFFRTQNSSARIAMTAEL